jgi:hypothetical protein
MAKKKCNAGSKKASAATKAKGFWLGSMFALLICDRMRTPNIPHAVIPCQALTFAATPTVETVIYPVARCSIISRMLRRRSDV